MPDNREYNGWPNKATWLVQVHIDDNQIWLSAVQELSKLHSTDANHIELGDSIKTFVEKVLPVDSWVYFPDTPRGRLSRDLFNYALGDVEWYVLSKWWREWYDIEGRE